MKNFRDTLPFTNMWLRGLPGTAHHEHSQTDEILAHAHQICEEAYEKGMQSEPDKELLGQLLEIAQEAADEIGESLPDWLRKGSI